MYMKKSIIIIVLFVLIALPKANAQQMPFSSQYYSNQFITNPAFTGNKGSSNAFLTHRSQFTGIEGGPQTTYLTVDGRMKNAGNKVGVGLYAYSDVTGILSRNGANATYSYRLDFKTPGHDLTFGLALGFVNNRINFSKMVVSDLTDPILTAQEQAKTAINADFGLAYHFRKLELGFAVPQLMGNKVDYKNNIGITGTYNMARHYYASAKYTFDVSQPKGIIAYPLLMVRSVQGAPFQYDVNAVIDWQRYGWFGVTYHSNYAVAISAGVRYKSLSIGYAYDMGLSKIRKYTGTTSEFLLSYNFGNENNSEDLIKKLQDDVKHLKEVDSTQAIVIDSLLQNDSIKQLRLDSLQKEVDTNTIEIDSLKKRLKEIEDKQTKHADPKDPGMSEEEKKKLADEKAKLEEELKDKQAKEDSLKLAKELEDQGVVGKTDNKEGYISIPAGTAVKAGYYVIIGAFTSVDNAKIFARDAKRKGYNTAVIIQNTKNSIFEIVVYPTDNKDKAIERLEQFKKDYPDVWVLTLE